MATIASLVPGIQIHAPGALDLTIKRLLIEVARDFCKKAKVWRIDLPNIDFSADTAVYTLTLPADTELVDIKRATLIGERNLDKKTRDQLSKIDYDYRTTSGTPRYFTREGTNQMRVYPVPASAKVDAITPYVVLRPTLAATTIDDVIIDDYEDVIRNGVLGKLFLLPNKAWSNPTLGGFYEKLYLDARDDAMSQANDDRMSGVVRKVKYGGY